MPRGIAPERHADPDLAGPLPHLVREHAVDANRGQEQRHRAEADRQQHRGPPAIERPLHALVHREHVEELHLRIDLRQRALNDVRERRRIAARPDGEPDVAPRGLRVRDVVRARPRDLALFHERLELHRRDDADHLHPRHVRARLGDVLGPARRVHAPADRVLPRPEERGEPLVEDDHARRAGRVALGEEAAASQRHPQRLEVAGRDVQLVG
jgi:hypothetical protein